VGLDVGRDGGGHAKSPARAIAAAPRRPALRCIIVADFARPVAQGFVSMSPLSLVFGACAFASGFALRTVDPLILPIAQRFEVTPATAALLTSAYALPYAFAQPLLGPLGDRFGKLRCIQACVVVLAVALVLGVLAPSFQWLLASRLLAGAFAGGLIPLVLAGFGDAYDLQTRQVMVGRLLVAIISGQMLGSACAGIVSSAEGHNEGKEDKGGKGPAGTSPPKGGHYVRVIHIQGPPRAMCGRLIRRATARKKTRRR